MASGPAGVGTAGGSGAHLRPCTSSRAPLAALAGTQLTRAPVPRGRRCRATPSPRTEPALVPSTTAAPSPAGSSSSPACATGVGGARTSLPGRQLRWIPAVQPRRPRELPCLRRCTASRSQPTRAVPLGCTARRATSPSAFATTRPCAAQRRTRLPPYATAAIGRVKRALLAPTPFCLLFQRSWRRQRASLAPLTMAAGPRSAAASGASRLRRRLLPPLPPATRGTATRRARPRPLPRLRRRELAERAELRLRP